MLGDNKNYMITIGIIDTVYINKRISDCYLTTNYQDGSYIIARSSYLPCDDNDVHIALDKLAYLVVQSVSSLKQQSAGRHVAPLGHIVLIASQPVFTFSLWCSVFSLCLAPTGTRTHDIQPSRRAGLDIISPVRYINKNTL